MIHWIRFLALGVLCGVCACTFSFKAGENVAEEDQNAPAKMAERLKWEQAAFNGEAQAQYLYGKSFCCGFDEVYDNAIASKWLCSAARQGYKEAQYEIGEIYRSDKALRYTPEVLGAMRLPDDDALAYVWYSIAAANGDEKARVARLEIAKRLATPERVKAKEMAMKYPAIPCEITQ